MNASTRPTPPPPESRTPLCSLCGGETRFDGESRLDCFACGCSWPSTNHWLHDGSWNEPNAEQCPATVQPYKGDERYPNLAQIVQRCVLSVGHPPPHRDADPSSEGWVDEDTDGYLTRACAGVVDVSSP